MISTGKETMKDAPFISNEKEHAKEKVKGPTYKL